MAKHTLSLEFPDTLNGCILRVVDTSLYDDSVPVECPYLDVQGPGFINAVRLDADPGFANWNLTACDLMIQTDNCGVTFDTIPDGIYIIKYSISPNDYVFVEYNHLRTTSVMSKFNEVLCSLQIPSCDPLPEVKEKLKELREIEMLLKAAKSKVEWCHVPGEGMDLYEYAKKRLDKLACTVCI